MLIQLGMALLRQFISIGVLEISIIGCKTHCLQADRPGPAVHLELASRRLFWRIVLKPDLAIGEAYMDGTLRIIDGNLDKLMAILMASNSRWQQHWLGRVSMMMQRVKDSLNRPRWIARQHQAKRNVAHHYDLSETLFDQFLDPRRQYSCAYFHHVAEPLTDAQITKIARIGAKLCLARGQKILDIGCGWGGLADALVDMQPGTTVTGITLSENQLAYARKQAAAQKKNRQLKFHLRDYRDQKGHFDRIVSVGMLEHVGADQFDRYFRAIAELLKPDGLAVVHAIGVNQTGNRCNRWLDKYIFPGGYLPSLEQMTYCASQQKLKILDIEIMRGHYAETLKAWRAAFRANIDVVRHHYDSRFIRMWEFYLTGCEYFSRNQDGMVFQLQLGHDFTAAPLTRSYITETETKYRTLLCAKPASGKTSL